MVDIKEPEDEPRDPALTGVERDPEAPSVPLVDDDDGDEDAADDDDLDGEEEGS